MGEIKEWNNPYNSFNSWKCLIWREWLEGCAKGEFLPPIVADTDPVNKCNFDCIWCLPKGTLILKDNWEYAPIETIEKNDVIIGFEENRKNLFSHLKMIKTIVKNVYKQRKSEFIEFVTEKGCLKITPEHRIWDSRGRWKKAENFKKGDYFLSFGFQSFIEKDDNLRRGWLAGIAKGDGCFWTINKSQRRQFRLAVIDTEILTIFKEYAKFFGFELYDGKSCGKRFRGYSIPAIYLTQDNEVKKFEDFLFNNSDSKNYKAGFLGGIFDAEGSLSRNILRISQYGGSTRDEIEKCLLDLDFNFVNERNGFRLKNGKEERIKFFNLCKPILSRKKDKLLGSSRNKVRILSIRKFFNYQDVYDLETDSHNFIANGIKVHNCNAYDYMMDKKSVLPEEHLTKLADFYREWGVKSTCIAGGGEPLLNPGVNNFLIHLKRNSIEAGIITNGSLMDQNFIAGHIEIAADTCRWYGISMDAGTSETYAKVKGITNNLLFNNVIQNIEKLTKAIARNKESTCDVAYKYLLHPLNALEIFKAAKLAKSIGVKDFHLRPVGWENVVKTKDKDQISFHYLKEKIDEQIERALELEDENFHFYGVRHKFNPNFERKVTFEKCRAIPLIATFGADGMVHLCVPKNTMIKTSKGSECIQDIKIGDNVFTHNKRYRKVIKTFKRDAEELIHINSFGWFEDLISTPEHPILVVKRKDRYCRTVGKACPFFEKSWKKCLNCDEHKLIKPKFFPAKDVKKGDYVFTPIDYRTDDNASKMLEDYNIYLDEDFAWLVGLYAAEGNILKKARKKDSSCGIQITLGNADLYFIPKVLKIIKKKFGKKAVITQINNRITIVLYKAEVGRLFKKLVGEYSDRKKLHNSFLSMPINLQKSLLFGWCDGDGHYRKKDNSFHIASISKQMIYQMWEIALRCNYSATVYDWKIMQKGRKQVYTLFLVINKKQKRNVHFWNGYLVQTVKQVYLERKKSDVYNIEVEDDNSYVANSIALHNCFDMRGRKDLILCSHYPDPHEILKVWGSDFHKKMIENIDPKTCPRCTFIKYNEIVENVFIKDGMCRNFP